MKKILCLVLFMIFSLSLIASEDKTKKEILNLKQKISNSLTNNTKLNESFYKHKLAQQQAKLMIVNTTNFIYRYQHGKRNYKQIKDFVESAYECSFIFPSLGEDHLDVFMTYCRWAEAETAYDANVISTWKKGQTIRSISSDGKKIRILTIKQDSKDYGILQVNNHNFKTVRYAIRYLYKTGVIPFKVKPMTSVNDLLDIKTNLIARSVIETGRKQLGWEYMHWCHNSSDFYSKLKEQMVSLKKQELYDTELVQKYYHLVPVKIAKV